MCSGVNCKPSIASSESQISSSIDRLWLELEQEAIDNRKLFQSDSRLQRQTFKKRRGGIESGTIT